MKVLKEKNTTIILENGWIEVDGEAEVFGFPINNVVAKNKSIPVYIKKGEIKIEGDYIALEGNTIPKSWEKLAKKKYSRIFLYGDVDTGKSSLATYLVNKMDGLKYVLDLDIGQSDIAHPGAMAFGCAKKTISISKIKMEDGFFIGSNSPMGKEAKCIRGVARLNSKLNERMNNDDKLIVDTTGWVRGKKARNYKLAKIEILNPDVVVCFDPFIAEFLDSNSNFDVFNVESFVVKKRSREQRISIRSKLYEEWLENAVEREFKIGEVKLGNTTLFKGKLIEDDDFIKDILDSKVLFVEKGYDFLNVCIEEETEVSYEIIKALKNVFNVEDVCIFSLGQLKGLILGLYSERYLGMGILKEINQKSIRVLTKIQSNVKLIEFGEFKLENMKEYIVRVP